MSKESTVKRITDELREWMNDNYPAWRKLRTGVSDQLDRIDKAHEEALREAYTAGRGDGMAMTNAKDAQAEYLRGKNDGYDEGYDEGFASADDALSREENGMLEEHGFIRMPKDADGKYWFCGDKIMLQDGNVVEIIGIGGDWLYYCVTSVAITVFGRIRAHDKRHYKQPTVEDTLREFARECLTYATCVDDHEVTDAIELYAAKLRLAGGDAE